MTRAPTTTAVPRGSAPVFTPSSTVGAASDYDGSFGRSPALRAPGVLRRLQRYAPTTGAQLPVMKRCSPKAKVGRSNRLGRASKQELPESGHVQCNSADVRFVPIADIRRAVREHLFRETRRQFLSPPATQFGTVGLCDHHPLYPRKRTFVSAISKIGRVSLEDITQEQNSVSASPLAGSSQ